MTERKEVRMTERVTIDVDPSIVEDLRRALGSLVTVARLKGLADTIEAALPKPEPVAGSVVRLGDGSVHARVERSPYPWVCLIGSPEMVSEQARPWGPRQWGHLLDQAPVLVFDGATLEGPQDAPRATHSHEQGEAVPKCQPGCAGRSEARRGDAQ